LNDLSIATSIHEELPRADEAAEEFFREMRKGSARPVIMLSSGRKAVADQYPAVTLWVDGGYGHIKIGDQGGFGFIARAQDYGGLVFEDDKPATLAEALNALEKSLTEWFKEQKIEVGR